MKKRWSIILLLCFVAIVCWFFWSAKDKELTFVPQDADAVVLIDVKKASQKYLFTLAKHPSLWFTDGKGSSKNSGIRTPDYIQIFHLKNSSFTEWYSIFEISDKNRFQKFLAEKGFELKNSMYRKDQFLVKVDGSRCVIGFSNKDFENKAKNIINAKRKTLDADDLIHNSVASVSYFSTSKIFKFSVDLNDNDIEIKTETDQDDFSQVISGLEKSTSFLKLQLDAKNIRITSELFNKKLTDSTEIKSVSAIAELEMVNDKIITYGYDDNFNEVEKVSYQKIIQPNYSIAFKSSDADKTWAFFQKKKWINAQNQLTLIPFQPNIVRQNGNEISVISTKKPIKLEKNQSGNYIFIKNNPLLASSSKTMTRTEKKIISKLDYLFYGNRSDYYYLKLQFIKEKFPVILR